MIETTATIPKDAFVFSLGNRLSAVVPINLTLRIFGLNKRAVDAFFRGV